MKSASVLGVVWLTYFVLVLLLWLPFGLSSGMPYETTLVLMSETRPWQDGFLYIADPLRIYESIFYHSAYLLGAAVTFPGDFDMYQVVYAVLWWARGALAFAIVRRLFPQYQSLAYLVGTLVLVHASDLALNWVGQLNQFGMIFWMMLSFFCLVVALQAQRWWRQLTMIALACTFAHLSLWSYESQIFVVSAFPLLAVAVLRPKRVRHLVIAALFCAVPGWFAVVTYLKYSSASGAATYQSSVVRPDFSAATLLSDLAFNVRAGLEFWKWGASVPYDDAVVPLGIGAAIVVLAGWAGVSHSERSARTAPSDQSSRTDARTLLQMLAMGASLLVLSFPVYLLLIDPRTLWRTQFLSGFGAALFLASLAGLAMLLPLGRLRRWLPPLAVSVIAAFGVAGAYKTSSLHYAVWERHRNAIEQVLHAAPSVRPHSFVMLVDVPPAADPFGHNMWFDVALRLAYPGIPVAGGYYLTGGKPAPGLGLVVENGQWTWNGEGFAPDARSIPLQNTVIIDYDESGRATIVEKVPDFVSRDQHLAAMYAPRSTITSPRPAERSVRQYLR
jgi:hypothetical protein